MDASRIVFFVVVALVCEVNYQYYDYKGIGPASPFADIYRLLPRPIAQLFRGAGKLWGSAAHGHLPVTLLPDHIMLCVPRTMDNDWKNAAPGSPEQRYSQTVHVFAKAVAARQAKPGVTYDEAHPEMSIPEYHQPWILYASAGLFNEFKNGTEYKPVTIKQYHSHGSNLICGNTEGNRQGPEYYVAYAYTFEGEALKVGDY